MRKDIFVTNNSHNNNNNCTQVENIRDPGTTLKMKQAATDVVSTYLQLTRTLGLADVDALSVGNLKVSGDIQIYFRKLLPFTRR